MGELNNCLIDARGFQVAITGNSNRSRYIDELDDRWSAISPLPLNGNVIEAFSILKRAKRAQ